MTRPIDEIAAAIRKALAEALADRQAELEAIAEHAKSDPYGDSGSILDLLSSVLGVLAPLIDLLAPELALAVDALSAADDKSGNAAKSFGKGYFMGYLLWQLAQPGLRTPQQGMERLLHSLPLDPQTAADLAARGLWQESDARFEAGGSGLDGKKTDMLIDAARQRPDLSQLLDLLNRGELHQDDFVTALHRHGFDDFWIPYLMSLRRPLLSPADIALASLRGNLTDAQVTGYRDILGLSPADMQTMIDNTGEPPGPEQLMEALRRGFIDHDRFVRGIRQSRVRNEWVDVEYALRESPMSTADAVRAVVEGHLTDDQGKAIAVQNGLMPEHWETLVQAWGRPLSHEQMLTLFHRGKATREEVLQAFHESDLKNKYAEQAIELGRHLVPERTIVSMVDHGVIAHDDAHRMLTEQGFNDADAEALIKLGAAQRTHAAKTLSRTDIVAMYEDSLLPERDAIAHLVKLGYAETDAHAMLALADVKAHASALRTLQRGIQAALHADHISKDDAIAELVKAGLDRTQATRLVDTWTQVKQSPTRTLTEAQVLKLAEQGLIGTDDCHARLVGLGLLAGDATLLMQSHGILPPPHPAPRGPSTGGRDIPSA